MVGFMSFQPSVSSLYAQSTALEAISSNIANATTDGYKRSEVTFATLTSRTVASAPGATGTTAPRNTQSDLGGVFAIEHFRIGEAGSIKPTGNDLDVAIAGGGFFMLATDPAKPVEIVYGRTGHFGFLPLAPDQTGGTLVDGNGYAVLGWPVTATGTATTTSPPAPITIDFGNTADPGRATTAVQVRGDLPATAPAGASQSLGLETYDANGQARPLSLTLTKQAANQWSLAIDGGAGQTVTLAPTGAPSQPASLAFDPLGQPLPPSTYTVTVTESDGSSSTFELDLGDVRQSGSVGNLGFEQNGYASGILKSIAFDSAGRVIGTFDNGRTVPLYQLAIASFVNPDGLAPLAGTVYAATGDSGLPSVGVAGDANRGTIMAGAIELSNVDLADEFSRMILVQHAYSSAAQAFQTVDEMMQVARDLKRA